MANACWISSHGSIIKWYSYGENVAHLYFHLRQAAYITILFCFQSTWLKKQMYLSFCPTLYLNIEDILKSAGLCSVQEEDDKRWKIMTITRDDFHFPPIIIVKICQLRLLWLNKKLKNEISTNQIFITLLFVICKNYEFLG